MSHNAKRIREWLSSGKLVHLRIIGCMGEVIEVTDIGWVRVRFPSGKTGAIGLGGMEFKVTTEGDIVMMRCAKMLEMLAKWDKEEEGAA